MQTFGKLVQRSLLASKTKALAPVLTAARFSSHHHHHDHDHGAWAYPVQARVQRPAPKFEAMSYYQDSFKWITLDDYKGKYVVLFFYPLDFTFVCPTEIVEFNAKAEEFRKHGTFTNSSIFPDHFPSLLC
jgi:hypothetical protein